MASAAVKKSPKVAIQGSILSLDPEDLTLGEMEEFEELAGRPLAKMLQGDLIRDEEGRVMPGPDGKPMREIDPRIKDIIALVFLAKRRDDPEFTLDQARAVKINELKLGGADPR